MAGKEMSIDQQLKIARLQADLQMGVTVDSHGNRYSLEIPEGPVGRGDLGYSIAQIDDTQEMQRINLSNKNE